MTETVDMGVGEYICMGLCFLFVLGLCFLYMSWTDQREYEIDHNKIDEGIVTSKEFEIVEDFPDTTDYYHLELDNNSIYEVDKDTYNTVKVGDYVKIYESKRVKIVEAVS